MTLLIGSEGSMGRRYQAILKHLDVNFDRLDVGLTIAEGALSKYDNYILATPTDTHFKYVKQLSEYQKPILCEKPISANEEEFNTLLSLDIPVSMMMQYQFFDRDYAHGITRYDFYNHGKDGIVWDCFQPIALARGEIDIKENSPIWTCTLNGLEINIKEMDRAYVWAVRRFLDGHYIPKETLKKWHLKVKTFEETWRNTQQSVS